MTETVITFHLWKTFSKTSKTVLPPVARGAVTINIRTLGFLRLYNGNAQSERDDPFQN